MNLLLLLVIFRVRYIVRRASIPIGRPTLVEVNLRVLKFNDRQIRKRIPKGVKILAVVKADAYGHGALPVSLALKTLGVECLGVAIPEEGVELRKGGVKTLKGLGFEL
jgi:alanine racemase